MNTPQNKQRHEERRRLWGRAKGKPLSAYQSKLVEELLPKLSVSITKNPLGGLGDMHDIALEIGFGGGEHILHQARRQPNTHFIGAEPFLNGIAKTLAVIDKEKLENISLHHGDAQMVIDNLSDASLNRVYILYPDPWPKPRHYKRRLIQDAFIGDIYRILKPGGQLYFASDIISYIDWALARILRYQSKGGGSFSWDVKTSADWLTPYKGWPSTRYEAKAFREGRTPHYFTFTKT